MKVIESLLRGEIPITREELKELINNDEDVRFVDTSRITDFSDLFKNKIDFNQDISDWNVANGIDFSCMFTGARSFNQPLNNWNVSKGENFCFMFCAASSFNQPLDNWNVSKGSDFNNMFFFAGSFNQPLDNWNVSNGTDFSSMFSHAILFNQPLNNWNVSNGTDFKLMFSSALSFNQPLDNWNINNDMLFRSMFVNCKTKSAIPCLSIQNIIESKISYFDCILFNNTIADEYYGLNNKILFMNYQDIDLFDIDLISAKSVHLFYDNYYNCYYFLKLNKNDKDYFYRIDEDLFNDLKRKNILITSNES